MPGAGSGEHKGEQAGRITHPAPRPPPLTRGCSPAADATTVQAATHHALPTRDDDTTPRHPAARYRPTHLHPQTGDATRAPPHHHAPPRRGALLATTTACARDTTPTEPTVDNATTTCVEAIAQDTGYRPVVQAVTPHADSAWTITGLTGPHTYTCPATYTHAGGGIRTDLRYEIDPPLDEATTT